ncbi:MAG TPA: sulfotransferase [Polyangiaceae bacterium]
MSGGPLFIVGMSRSGTQLLRELLNRHPGIAIPRKETHFIPLLLRRFVRRYGEDERRQAFRIVRGSDFYEDLRLAGHAPDDNELRELMAAADVRQAVERLMRRCAVSEGKQAGWLWGDKTPNNMVHLPLLAQAFPRARMLHIIRDPRDRAASARRVWGADPLLSAELWARKVATARRDGMTLGERYRELRYEELVADVERRMRKVCEWLELEFDAGVTRLERPPDKYAPRAEASGRISASRTAHRKDELAPAEVRRIEEIVAPVAIELGYLPRDSAARHRGVTFGERLFRVGVDRGRKAGFFLRRWGLRGAVRHIARRAFLYRLGTD